MGLGFAIIRPTAALITGVCGGLLVNRLVRDEGVRGYWNDWSAPYHKEGNDMVYMNYITRYACAPLA